MGGNNGVIRLEPELDLTVGPMEHLVGYLVPTTFR